MSIPTLNATVQIGTSYNASLTQQGSQYTANSAQGNPAGRQNFTVGTTGSNKINEIYSVILKPAASGNSLLDLTSLADVFGLSLNFARVKAIMFQLLSANQDASNGTACTQITIGAAGSHPWLMFLGGTTPTVILKNGEMIAWMTPSSDGSVITGGSNNMLLITNNDTVNAAAVQVTLLGADA